jgi:hypothetical protein
MRKFEMPQGFPVHIKQQETQGNIGAISGGLGVASSNLAAPTKNFNKVGHFRRRSQQQCTSLVCKRLAT